MVVAALSCEAHFFVIVFCILNVRRRKTTISKGLVYITYVWGKVIVLGRF